MSRKPKSTETAGSRLKRALRERYEGHPGEEVMFEHAAELADLAERLAARIREEPLVSLGAAEQVVAHPLHADFYACVTKFSAVVDALQLPDRPTGKLSTTARAVRAAQARWARQKGRAS